MTFEEWWKTYATECEIPKTGHTHSLIKRIAEVAWHRGYAQAWQNIYRAVRTCRMDQHKDYSP